MIRKQKIEQLLQDKFLQSHIEIKYENTNKIYKQGYVILFNIRDYFLIFTIKDSKKKDALKTIELPYPFKIDEYDDQIIFDYTIDSLANGNETVYNMVKSIPIKHRLYNKRVVLSVK